ncbi:MAG: nodulation protein NfeD [Nitrospirae bacterium]|nr:nodulation protein NfeD [Nitrospirota bacterium]
MKKCLYFIWFLLLTLPSGMSGAAPAPVNIPVIRAEGIVGPVMAEFISGNIDSAAGTGAALLVIELDTPGGLDTSMRMIVKKIVNSPIPVAVYVAPGGARAASAGVFIAMAAHVAAMSPGTNIGAAHPVELSGGKMDETMSAKVTNDSVAFIRSLAEKRGRNSAWAEDAVRKSASITETEALSKKVVDIVAVDLSALLAKIDGMNVSTVSGETVIRTAGAVLQRREMPLRLRILDVVGNPNIAYLLMLAGIIGLYVELTNPGVIFPGVAGAICLILSFYALQTLPVNYAGVLLILLAVVFFILEIKVTSYGLLTIGGIISLVAGSLMLFDSPSPFFRVSLIILLPTVVIISALFVAVTWFVIRAQRAAVITGAEGMIGMEGTALTDIAPGGEGQVAIHGEIWRAGSAEAVGRGEHVVAVSVSGLKIEVKRSS